MERKFSLELEFTDRSYHSAWRDISKAAKITGHKWLDILTYKDPSSNSNGVYSRAQANGTITDYWVLKPECSTGLEINTPAFTETGLLEKGLTRALKPFRTQGLSRRCGMHVHVDARDLIHAKQLAWIFLRFRRNQSTFFYLHPRYSNRMDYCETLSPYSIDQLARKVLTGAFKTNATRLLEMLYVRTKCLALTGCHYPGYGTLEFRLAPGTRSPKDAAYWGYLCSRFVECTVRSVKEWDSFPEIEKPKDFFGSLDLPKKVLEWALQRFKRYNRGPRLRED